MKTTCADDRAQSIVETPLQRTGTAEIMMATRLDFSDRLIAAFNTGRPGRVEGMSYEHISNPEVRLDAATKDFRLLLKQVLGDKQADMLVGATADCRKSFEWAEGFTNAATFLVTGWQLSSALNLEKLAQLPGAVAVVPFNNRDGFMTYQAVLQTKVDLRHRFVNDPLNRDPEWNYCGTAVLFKAAGDDAFRALVPEYEYRGGKTKIAPLCKVQSLDRNGARLEMDPNEAAIAADQYQI